MNALIIEDEFRNANRLRKMLVDIDPEMRIDGPLETVTETRQWLRSHPAPDVIFADIRLSDGVSFDALDAVDSHTAVVFTTAYDEYALQAFQYNGIAYLMKPIEEEELRATVQRIKDMKGSTAQPDMNAAMLRELLSGLRQTGATYRERFLIPYKDGFEVVSVKDVSHIFSEFKTTRLCLKDGTKYTLNLPLDDIEQQLDPNRFFRVNRQFIVSVDCVAGLKTYFGGKIRVRIRNFEELEVMCSRDKAPMLKAWLNK